MHPRLGDVPVYEVVPMSMEAARFNRVRRALMRLENPLRVELPGLRTLDIVIDDEAWIVVDRLLSEVPVVAWTNFQAAARAGIHADVDCEIRFYHAQADRLAERILVIMDGILDERLGGVHGA